MLRFLSTRLAGMLVVLAIVAVLVFVLTRAASGDPISVMLGDQATATDIARVQKEYGLDKPLPVQFGYWLREVLQGNLGQSIFLQRPVTQALAERAEPTTLLSLMAVAIAALIGLPCGIVSAVFRGRVVDQLFTGIAMLGASIPSFWLGIVLIQIFAVSFGWFPVSGYGAPGAALAERLHALILPAAVLGLLNSALIIRFTRASMLDVLGEDYVRTARSKGLPPVTVDRRHVLRNALLPVSTIIGLQTGLLLSGAVLTETVFAYPGMGSWLRDAIFARDYPVLQGGILFLAFVFVVVNLIVDISYAIINPRIRYS